MKSNDNIPAAELRLAESIAREAIRVKQANERFAGLSPAKKRVAIAKDVIAWLNVGKLAAESGTYLDFQGAAERTGSLVNDDETCKACALGAIFACTAVKVKTLDLAEEYKDPYNGQVTYGGVGSGSMRKQLEPYFSRGQLFNIENAFERSAINSRDVFAEYGIRDEYSLKAIRFARRVDDDGERLRLIMENIIANNGEFVP